MTVASEAVTDPIERDFLKKLGKNVRVRRVMFDLSQQELAQRARMSRNFVSSVERGAHGVDIVRVVRLAMALGVTVNELVPSIPEQGASEPPVARSA